MVDIQPEPIGSLYEWQNDTWAKWANTGFKGVLSAFVSAGKTRAGCKCIRKFIDVFGPVKVWVLAPRTSILDGWKPYLDEYDIYAELMTYESARGRMARSEPNELPSLLILDECQTVKEGNKASEILNYGIEHILAMSGTPDGSDKLIGPIFQTVSVHEANIAPTLIHYISYSPAKHELDKYNVATMFVNNRRTGAPLPPGIHIPYWMQNYNLDRMRFYRRDVAYKFESRLPIALSLIKKYKGDRMMVFCARNKQVEQLSKLLKKENISHCMHVTGKENLDDFISGKENIILSCKKIDTGFSDITVTRGILVSYPLSEVSHTQTIGRIVRPMAGKEAHIYVLIAKGTNDEDVISNGGFPKDMRVREDWDDVNQTYLRDI